VAAFPGAPIEVVLGNVDPWSVETVSRPV